MSYAKHGAGLLGLLAIMALGVLAFAASAQALTPEFLINKKLALAATVTGESESVKTLSIPALSTEINCKKFTVKAGSINTGTDASVTLLYEECTALDIKTKAELAGCHIINTATDFSLHITVSTLILPVEFASGDFGLLFEKITGKIILLKGTECVLPVETSVKGEVCSLITPATNDTVKPLIEFSEAIQKSCPERKVLEDLAWPPAAGFKDKILFGAQEAFISGKAILSLTGAHAGLTLGVSLQ
jgi:hypothetical protein